MVKWLLLTLYDKEGGRRSLEVFGWLVPPVD